MAIDTAKEQHDFQSEVRQLLHLVINSLYSNREIFLRELISNASDAVDKLRFAALSDDSLFEGEPEFEIQIDFSDTLNTVTVRDNGVGMNRAEAVDNLGTIAKSGTKEFFGAISGDSQKDSQLIGQFGVGFYAAFIVADKVVVTSRRAGLSQDEGVRWESDGKGEFSVETVRRKKRGTEIVLHLKDDAKEFANGYRLREICKRYSDHIPVPVSMPKSGEGETGSEVVNEATALWQRGKNEITDEEYKEFYKHIAHDFSDPLKWVHSKVEGKLEYTTLFYLPSQAPFDLWDRQAKYGAKLYVRRVFIMDDVKVLLPSYLRFIRGVIDSQRPAPQHLARGPAAKQDHRYDPRGVDKENPRLARRTGGDGRICRVLGQLRAGAERGDHRGTWRTRTVSPRCCVFRRRRRRSSRPTSGWRHTLRACPKGRTRFTTWSPMVSRRRRTVRTWSTSGPRA